MASCGFPGIIGPGVWDIFVQQLQLTTDQEKGMLKASMARGVNNSMIVNKS